MSGSYSDQGFRTINEALKSWGAWKSRAGAPRASYRSPIVFQSPEVYRSYWKPCRTCTTIADGRCPSCGVAGCQKETHSCPTCGGAGGRRSVYRLVDPVAIPGKSVMTVVFPAPSIFDEIDRSVRSFDAWRQSVLLSRYVFCHKKSTKERVLRANRMLVELRLSRVSVRQYRRILGDAKERLSRILGVDSG